MWNDLHWFQQFTRTILSCNPFTFYLQPPHFWTEESHLIHASCSMPSSFTLSFPELFLVMLYPLWKKKIEWPSEFKMWRNNRVLTIMKVMCRFFSSAFLTANICFVFLILTELAFSWNYLSNSKISFLCCNGNVLWNLKTVPYLYCHYAAYWWVLSPVAILKEIVIPVKEKAVLHFKGSKTLDNTKGKVLVKIVHFMKW